MEIEHSFSKLHIIITYLSRVEGKKENKYTGERWFEVKDNNYYIINHAHTILKIF